MLRRADEQRHLEVVLLDSDSNGIDRISAALNGRHDISAIHIISHGSDGEVQLGAARLNFDSLLQNAGQIRGWGQALSGDADLLIYGCDVAQDDAGKSLVDALSRLTGADVAASDDLTGASNQGGDWTLEYHTGHIDTGLAISASEQMSWSGTLATYTVTSTADAGAGTLREAITNANANGGADTIDFAIAGAGAHTINVASALPTITGPLLLDGWSQGGGGYNGTPLIILDGNGLAAHGLQLTADGNTIRGFVVRDFGLDGIRIAIGSDNNVIQGNYLGALNESGTFVAGEENTQNGLRILGANNTVGGTSAADRNVLSGNTEDGIKVEGAGASGNVILGNYVGTNAAGTAAVANSGNGLVLRDSANNNTIGGTAAGSMNVISGNGSDGVSIEDASNNSVLGNYIGTDAAGTADLGNAATGVNLDSGAATNTIGGTSASARNVVSGNGGGGIEMNGAGTSGNLVLGNYVGTNAAGTAAIGNSGIGVMMRNSASSNTVGGTSAGAGNLISGNLNDGVGLWESGTVNNVVLGNKIGTNAAGTGEIHNNSHGVTIWSVGTGNIIGGTAAGAANLISGNWGNGVRIDASSGTTVQGNLIGVTANGTAALGNSFGVVITSASGNTIGGTAAGAANVISGNSSAGIQLTGAATTANVINGNLIGLGSDGTTAVGNTSSGVEIRSSAANNTVGGTAAGAGNTIANNQTDGVRLLGTAGNGNSILANAIYSNTNDGIDLSNNGVTANDVNDGDTGPNALQNFPVISGASYSGTTLTLNGSLNAIDGTYRIEFFANTSADAGGYGEGRRYLGFTNLLVGANNGAFINLNLTVAMTAGETVVATATSPTGDTSEFGLNVSVTFTNAAPVLSGANNLTSILEDPSSNNGTLVSALISGQVTDGDAGALSGIAVTAVDNTNGTWEYTTNGGGQWNSFSTPSAAASRLLAADGSTYVRFVPNANWNGTVNNGITFRAWDQTTGTAGNTADTSSNGGATAFSSATASASVTVTSVNDAPAGANNTVTAVQDNDYTFAAADLGFTDPNDSAANALSAVTITTIPGVGSLRLSGVAVTAGQSVSAANITAGNLKFTPAAGQSGSGYASFTFQVQDNGGTANSGVDLDQSANTMTVDVASTYTVAGTVYHDVDGDADVAEGGTGTFRSVTVHLYQDDGDGVIEASDALVATTTTNAAGAYSFSGVVNATYWVVVDSRTIGNAADVSYNGGFGIGDVWAEQTYGDNASTGALDLAARYGGRNVGVDTAGNPSNSEHIARVGVAGGNVSAVNWGFSFNAITETRGDDVDDDGAANRMQQGTLRQFLLNSHAISGVQTSNFSIGGGGVQTIAVTSSALPTITDAVVLDATSQEGFAGTPLIILDGNRTVAEGLRLSADGSTIRGLVIRNFDGNGIRINAGSDNNVIQGNYIGALDEAGSLAAGTANTQSGVRVQGANNTIGGTSAADRNVMSANTGGGITLTGAGATGNIILGNYVGTNAAGTADVGNADDGITIGNGAQNNTIGGTAAAARNVVSGNEDDGIDLDGAGTSGNVILGNYIGLNAAGTAALGNDGDGIVIGNLSSSNTIGGSAAGAGNVISGNDTEGVRLNNASTGTIVRGNLIGLNAAGTITIGNDNDGVSIAVGSSNNTIGGTGAGDGNIIAGNENGVQITGASTGNAILGNSIYGNAGIGIDLNNDGVNAPNGTTNGAQPNIDMDTAVIQSALLGGTSLTLTGYVGNMPSSVTFAGARVEIFLSDDDASGWGEGRTYLGFLTANGNSQFSGVLTVTGLSVGDKITGTATDAAGNTSEFALNFTTVADPGSAPVNTVPGAQSINEDTATAIAGISVNDTNGNLATVALGVGNGVLTVNLAGGASISAGANGTGALTLSGTQAQINAALATLSYQGSANFTGADTLTVVSTDTGALSDTDNVSINVVSINDAAAGTNNTITTAEDVAYVFAAADFGFTDPNDSPANALSGVTITTIPGAGGLTLSGVGVTAGQLISVADITAGNLRFTAAGNASGASYTSFTFQVQDNGGTANGGVDLDATPNALTIDVTSVNDPPAGANNTVTTLEDTAYTFAAADFGFSDASDTPANALSAVTITTIPVAGSLMLSGVAVTAGQTVSVANITAGNLRFTPGSNAVGAGHASFTFQVQDNGGTANGGVDLDATPNTLTIDVTTVNDAPAGTNNTVTMLEDTAYTFAAVDFGFSDAADSPSNALSAVTITTIPGAGSLTLSGVGVTAGQSISVADITAGNLRFTAAGNASGASYTSFTFQVQDNGGTANGGVDLDATANTLTIDVTAVNDAPAGADNTVTTSEDIAYTFAAADFGFSDASDTPANALSAVTIATIPVAGSLTLSGVAVTAGQTVSAANITAGNLRFTPGSNAVGAGHASFTFQVQDNGGIANGGVDLDATPNTLTIDVTTVNDAPGGTDNTVTTLEDSTYVFAAGDFGFSDATDSPSNTLSGVRITTIPAAGALTLSGVAVTAGQTISALNITSGNLRFAPGLNGAGASYASFTFQVQDDGGTASGGVNLDATPNTLTIAVTAVNDAPTGIDNTVTAQEDSPYTFATADFGFNDASDSPGNALSGVRITTLPGAGTLVLSGAAVSAGQTVSSLDIASGNLQLLTTANASGAGYASFTFQVQDNGGTANGGVRLDASANTLTIDIYAVDDAPIITNNTLTLTAGDTIVLSSLDLGATDLDDPAGSLVFSLSAVTHGRFELAGAPGVALGSFTQAQLAAGQVRFVHDASIDAPTYGISVSDGTFPVGPSFASISFTPPVVVAPEIPTPSDPPPPGPTPQPPTPTDDSSGDVESTTPEEQREQSSDAVVAAPADQQPAPDSSVTTFSAEVAPRIAQRIASFTVQNAAVPSGAVATPSVPTETYAAVPTLDALSTQQVSFSMSAPSNWSISNAYTDSAAAVDKENSGNPLLVSFDSTQLGGMALSAGAVWWASRISGLVGSLIASIPAWRQLDPLLVVNHNTGEEDATAEGFDAEAEADEIAIAMVLEGPNTRAAA